MLLGPSGPAVDHRNTETNCNAAVESNAGVRIQQQRHCHGHENSTIVAAPGLARLIDGGAVDEEAISITSRPFRPRQGARQSSSPESLSLQPCVYASPSSLRSARRSSRSSGFNDLAINCRMSFSLLFVFDVVVSAPWMSTSWL